MKAAWSQRRNRGHTSNRDCTEFAFHVYSAHAHCSACLWMRAMNDFEPKCLQTRNRLVNKSTSRQAVRLNEISICLLKCSPTAENCLPGRGQHHCDIIALRYHGNMPKCLDARGTTGMSTRRSSRYIHGDAVAAGKSNK